MLNSRPVHADVGSAVRIIPGVCTSKRPSATIGAIIGAVAITIGAVACAGLLGLVAWAISSAPHLFM